MTSEGVGLPREPEFSSARVLNQKMSESTFRYKATGQKQNPLKDCSKGIHYINASGNDPELAYPCVIMNYNLENEDKAVSQIKLSREMGDEYALEVLHVDNRFEMLEVNVIYPSFEDTMFDWLEKLKANHHQWSNRKDYCEWMKVELVLPKIRKIWNLLLKMKEKNILFCNEEKDQGYNMPLISGVPKLLNLRQGKCDKNLDENYAISVFREIIKLDATLELVPKNFQCALDCCWGDETKRGTSKKYYLCSKHPVLYNPAEKREFLLLMNDITNSCGLKGFLDDNLDWEQFRGEMNGVANEKVYVAILRHTRDRSFGSASKKRMHHNAASIDSSDEESRYSRGSDIVRYARNALMHFQETYRDCNNKEWDRSQDGEIVEILDNDLKVCSSLFSIAMQVVTNEAPKENMEKFWKKGNWKGLTETKWSKAKEELNCFFNSLK